MVVDTSSLVRRQELLSRARRARHEWVESCRLAKPVVWTGKEESRHFPGTWRRACEVEVIAASSAGTFGSAGRVTELLSEVVDDDGSYPLVPLAGDERWTKKVEEAVEKRCAAARCEALESGEDAEERVAETEVDALIEALKKPEAAEVVRSAQHFVDAELRRRDDDDDEEEVAEDEAQAKRRALLARRKVAADLLFSGEGDAEIAAAPEKERDAAVKREEASFAEPVVDPAAQRLRERVVSLAERVSSALDPSPNPSAVETLLYRKLAPVAVPDRPETDARFLARFEALEEVVDFEQLGAKAPASKRRFDDGCEKLALLDQPKLAPSDLVRVLAVAATRFLRSAHATESMQQENNAPTPPSTDDVLPSFVVGLIRAKPRRCASVAAGLRRSVDSLSGRQAYLVTNYLAALDFIHTLDPAALDRVDPTDLRRRLDLADKKSNDARLVRHSSSASGRPASTGARDLGPAFRNAAFALGDPGRPGRREVSAREVRALRLARRAEFAVQASALAGRRAVAYNSSGSQTANLLSDYHGLLAQVDALSPYRSR